MGFMPVLVKWKICEEDKISMPKSVCQVFGYALIITKRQMEFISCSFMGLTVMINNIDYFVGKNLSWWDMTFPDLSHLVEMHRFAHLSTGPNVYEKIDIMTHNFL